ncbi:hypothetical protein PanWU01x14_194840 [Parasponia andersonii]|uniref:Uncharacterized protein n=1 Tax=Parasponia andersonii TaxID=3476 RepID=A0A2P5C079_PARAD|nr:hypothetical protein PanWU01x14_194840 [Parasponia andersonii]
MSPIKNARASQLHQQSPMRKLLSGQDSDLLHISLKSHHSHFDRLVQRVNSILTRSVTGQAVQNRFPLRLSRLESLLNLIPLDHRHNPFPVTEPQPVRHHIRLLRQLHGSLLQILLLPLKATDHFLNKLDPLCHFRLQLRQLSDLSPSPDAELCHVIVNHPGKPVHGFPSRHERRVRKTGAAAGGDRRRRQGVVVGEEADEVSDEVRERTPGVGPGVEVRTGGDAGGRDEGVVRPESRARGGVRGDENDWRHERVVLVEPDGEWDEGSGGGDVEVSGDTEEAGRHAVVVDECAGGGSETGEVLEEGDEVVSDEPFLVGV